MPPSACGGVFCSCLLQFSQAISSPPGAVSTLIGLFSFAAPALFLVHANFGFETLEHAQVIRRMDLASDELSDRTYPRAARSGSRQQRGHRMDLFEVLDDRQ